MKTFFTTDLKAKENLNYNKNLNLISSFLFLLFFFFFCILFKKLFLESLRVFILTKTPNRGSKNIFYCNFYIHVCTGVGPQVLTTLVTALPLTGVQVTNMKTIINRTF